ncbi:SDR family oxidoreductase [Croceicoccus sp. F390]|uniref:SDR family oxidoreductase n=1 Tax=Croceicoccus esteveae TaxID=3075597 RepID=A0ABU2ZE46_9SPHN|nr:SDR family oxidoreductase [Croceicoccus sp. F390]MDT0574872.1 SDR family oxidoreductase [Croceicoccus sp. F390]
MIKPATANDATGRGPPVALVTGSTRGIGKAIANSLEARGVTVLRHGSGARAGETGAPDGEAARQGALLPIMADFDDPAAPAQLWETALQQAGGTIDILVNNAGLFAANPIGGSDIKWLDEWDRTLRINLTAAAQLSRLAVRHWLETKQGTGRLVNIASRAAYRGDSPEHWHYAAAKSGLVAMTKTVARSYAADGVLAFAICPGFVDTAPAGDYLESRGGPKLLADIPLGRVALPEEIASIAGFCALDAPHSMTGAVIDANGASFVR